MAIVFQLIVSFPLSVESEVEAAGHLTSEASLHLKGHRLEVHEPYSRIVCDSSNGSRFIEFAVHPCGVGRGGPGQLAFPLSEVTHPELMGLGEQLYDLLRKMQGFSAGYVGWDSEWLVDIADLASEWVPDGSIYDLTGLVVANSLAEAWSLDDRFVPFSRGHRWLPYKGTQTQMQ